MIFETELMQLSNIHVSATERELKSQGISQRLDGGREENDHYSCV